MHLQNFIVDTEFEAEAQAAIALQQSVLPVDMYLEIEKGKSQLQLVDESDSTQNMGMLGEWENIHNKVLFDAINEALDNFRPYGLRGPPLPWS